MFRTMIAAAALLASTAASANSPTVFLRGDSAHVRYSDLDLQSHAGRSTMLGRIHRAAQLLCGTSITDASPFEPMGGTCFRVATADGIKKMNAIGGR
jgi:UrcA family protein